MAKLRNSYLKAVEIIALQAAHEKENAAIQCCYLDQQSVEVDRVATEQENVITGNAALQAEQIQNMAVDIKEEAIVFCKDVETSEPQESNGCFINYYYNKAYKAVFGPTVDVTPDSKAPKLKP